MGWRRPSYRGRRVGSLAAIATVVIVAAAPMTGATAEVAVEATASTTTSGAVRVEWDAVPESIGYLVVIQRLAGETWVAVADRQFRVTTVRPVLIDGLTNGESYRACVAAVRADGFRVGLSSAAVPFGLPGQPIITEVTPVEGGLTVEWTPAAPNGRAISAYAIAVTPADVEEIIVGGAATSVTIEDLNPDVSYTITVRATNLRGQGEPSESSAGAQPLTIAFRPTDPTSGHDPVDDLASRGLVRAVSAGPCAAPVAAAPPEPGTGPVGSTPGSGSSAGASDSTAGREEPETVTEVEPDRPAAPVRPSRPTAPEDDAPEEEDTAPEDEAAESSDAPMQDPSPREDEGALAPSAPVEGSGASSRRASIGLLVALALLVLGVGGVAVMRRQGGPVDRPAGSAG